MSETTNPLEYFTEWLTLARSNASIQHPSSMCLSTTDSKRPSSRMVDLRCIENGQFIFSTNLSSLKAQNIYNNSTVALLFWWDALDLQVRISGVCERVDSEDEQRYFEMLPREWQLCLQFFQQGAPLQSHEYLSTELAVTRQRFEGEALRCPEHWGSFAVTPKEFDFLSLRDDRLHFRQQYLLRSGTWKYQLVQP